MSGLAWLAAAGLLAWAYLLFFRRGFWRARERLRGTTLPARWPDVVALVPARNEAASIAEAVASIRAQDYPGRLRVVVIDDASEDETAERARQAGAEVLAAPPLAPGWTGKLWALAHGVERTAGERPDFYWLSDADIVHPPHLLARLVAKAEKGNCDLVSLMVRLRCESFWEKRLVPAFVFFFQMLYPFAAVNDPKSAVAGAAGGCVLLRRRALERAGGLRAIRGAVIDDCTLAARIKGTGGRLWLGLAEESRCLRGHTALAPLIAMVRRSAFAQLRYSAALLVVTLLAMGVVFLAPPVATFVGLALGDGAAATLGGLGWIAMAAAYRPTLVYYLRPAGEAILLPLIAILYAYATLVSAIDHWRRRGSRWKGRSYGPTGARLDHAPEDG
ncbi:MAG: glycosyltransferase [Alphaproteobacteria bacterium]|nr:MAG: glycosyltransferase [Alphaproteobacteria bacterium]